MVFGNFEDIVPISICFDELWKNIIFKEYCENIISLIKKLILKLKNDNYIDELKSTVELYEQNHNWYDECIYPLIKPSINFKISSRLLVLPERLEDLYVIKEVKELANMERFIYAKLKDFISIFDIYYVLDYIFKQQSINLSFRHDVNDEILFKHISRSSLTGGIENIEPKSKELLKLLLKNGFSAQDLEIKMRAICLEILLAGTSDQQRYFRFCLKAVIKEHNSGNKKPKPGEILYFLKLVNWIVKFDILKYHVRNKIELFFIENDTLTFFYIPKIQREKLPNQILAEIQMNRLNLMSILYPIYGEDNPYQKLIDGKWKNRYKELETVHSLFDNYPLNQIYKLQEEDIKIYESLIPKDYSPISYLLNVKGEKVYFTSKIQLMDADFRFYWHTRHKEHFKIYGTAFENFVTNQLASRTKYTVVPNRYFMKKQYDQFLCCESTLFVIDSKDLKLLENVDELKKLNSRKSELEGYCKYLKEKAFLIKENFSEFLRIFPEFLNIEYLIPVIISNNPEYFLEFNDVCIITLEEFLQIYEIVIKKVHRSPKVIQIRGNYLDASHYNDYFLNFHSFKVLSK